LDTPFDDVVSLHRALTKTNQVSAMDAKATWVALGHQVCVVLGISRVPTSFAPVGDPDSRAVAPFKPNDELDERIDRTPSPLTAVRFGDKALTCVIDRASCGTLFGVKS